VACGMFHVAAWSRSEVVTWGYNLVASPLGLLTRQLKYGDICGQLGRGLSAKSLEPGKIKLPPNVEVFSVACGAAHTMLLTDQGLMVGGEEERRVVFVLSQRMAGLWTESRKPSERVERGGAGGAGVGVCERAREDGGVRRTPHARGVHDGRGVRVGTQRQGPVSARCRAPLLPCFGLSHFVLFFRKTLSKCR
jgi:hypothetical protein